MTLNQPDLLSLSLPYFDFAQSNTFLIGGLIPIFQGWVFGSPGLIILADYFPPVKRILDWAKSKYGNESGNKSS